MFAFLGKLYYYFFQRKTKVVDNYITKEMSFEKEDNGNWYAVIPEWKGFHGALTMVAGADEVLEYFSGGIKRIVTLNISNDTNIYEKWNRRELVYIAYHEGNGNYWIPRLAKKIWLCGVTNFVFGKYPEQIYFTVKRD